MSVTQPRAQNLLEFYKQAYEQSLIQIAQQKENLKIHKQIIVLLSGGQAGEPSETVSQFQSLVAQLEDQIAKLRSELDVINTKLLIQNQIAHETSEEYEFKTKELKEKIDYLELKLQDKESILQFKEKKWSEFEFVVNKFVKINPNLLDEFSNINYLCDDLSSVRNVNTVLKENDWLKERDLHA